MDIALRTALLELSEDEKVEAIHSLEKSLGEQAESAPLTQAQKDELDCRWQDYLEHPEDSIPWAEVKRRLRGGT